MKKTKLISMVDYVYNLCKDDHFVPNILNADKGFEKYWVDTREYALLLKRPLELGMFIPCDKDGNQLQLPIQPTDIDQSTDLKAIIYDKQVAAYNEACDKIIFPHFTLLNTHKNVYVLEQKRGAVGEHNIVIGLGFEHGAHKTIQDLVRYNLDIVDN